MKNIAVISDIHGNNWALEKVLQDIDNRGISDIVNLGDCFYGPLDPLGTAELLSSHQIPTVRGNEDRLVTEVQDDSSQSKTVEFVRKNLKTEHLNWLTQLKTNLTLNNLFMCHGTPVNDTEYLLWEINSDNKVIQRSAENVGYQIKSIESPVVLCGHSHVPQDVQCPNGTCVIDPGSIGLQAYTDDMPVDHGMETGSPHARYAIITFDGERLSIQRIEISYDWEAAARTAEINGRDDWAY